MNNDNTATTGAAEPTTEQTQPALDKPPPSPPVGPDEVDKIVEVLRDVAGGPSLSSSPSSVQPPVADLTGGGDDEVEKSASYYWDASTMAPLNAASVAAVARLRAFRPPAFPLWDRLPLGRRAAVLILLYADRRGDLRVVLTMRAASLRHFSGHAAFPGGKADTLDETPYQIARREAWEEIGLPQEDARLPRPFRIEHLCYLPYNLAKTELVVRPCVALLHPDPALAAAEGLSTEEVPDAAESLIPRLDAKEVAAVFSAPFHNFLRVEDEAPPAESEAESAEGKAEQGQGKRKKKTDFPPGKWYEGSWTHWHEEPWRMHYFYVPVHDQRVAKPRRPSPEADGTAAASEDDLAAAADRLEAERDARGRYMVWGMTARILVDAATVAYGEAPEFEHNAHFGDERMIEGLARMGRLGEKKKKSSTTTGGKDGGPGVESELTHEDLKEASRM